MRYSVNSSRHIIKYPIDWSIILSPIACLFILFTLLIHRPRAVYTEESFIKEEPKRLALLTENLSELLGTKPGLSSLHISHLEETPEYSAVFYAIEPIGRYYITAYNHLETGGKKTASGTTCHEGNITTCAADVWGGYFKFGDYIEVGGRLYRIEDTGSAVKRRHIDIYFASYKEMANYNSHYETIYRVSFPFGIPKEGE